MNLSEEQANELMFTLGTKGWTDIILPYIQERGKRAMESLLQVKEERSGEFKNEPDDALRYRVREIEHFIKVFVVSVRVWQENERRRKQQEQDINPPAVGSPYGETPNGEPVLGA